MINVARQVINNIPSVPKTNKKQEAGAGLLQRTQTKKQENNPTILEERIVDTLPSDVEWEKTEDEK